MADPIGDIASNAAEVEKIVVSLLGDNKSYKKMLDEAKKDTKEATKSIDDSFKSVAKNTEALDDAGDAVKKLADAFGSAGLAKTIGVADAEYNKFATSAVVQTRSLEKNWKMLASAWATVSTGIGVGAAGLKKSFSEANTASGALAFGLKAGGYAAVATALAAVAYKVYEYAASQKKLNEELDATAARHEKVVNAYKSETEAIIGIAQVNPEAKSRNKDLFESWEGANKVISKTGDSVTTLKKRLSEIRAESGLSRILTLGFGDLSGVRERADAKLLEDEKNYDKLGMLGKAKTSFGRATRDAFEWAGSFFEGASAKRVGVDLEGAKAEQKAAELRVEAIVKLIADASKTAEKAFVGTIGGLKMENLTHGMTGPEKTIFNLNQQIEKLKASTESLFEMGEFDEEMRVWERIAQFTHQIAEAQGELRQQAINKTADDFKNFANAIAKSNAQLELGSAAFKKWEIRNQMGLAANKELAEHIEKLLPKYDALIEKEAELKEFQREKKRGEEITNKFMPAEKLRKEAEEITKVFEHGHLTEEVYIKAMDDLQKKFDEVADKANKAHREIQKFDAALVGSAEDARRLSKQLDIFAPRGTDIAKMKDKAIKKMAGEATSEDFDSPATSIMGMQIELEDFEARSRLAGPKFEGRPDVFDFEPFFETHGPPKPYVPMGPEIPRHGTIEEAGGGWLEELGRWIEAADTVLNPFSGWMPRQIEEEQTLINVPGVTDQPRFWKDFQGLSSEGQSRVLELLNEIAKNTGKKDTVEVDDDWLDE